MIDQIKSLRPADEQTRKYLAEQVLDLDEKVKNLTTEANIMLKNPPLQNKAPGLSKRKKNPTGVRTWDHDAPSTPQGA